MSLQWFALSALALFMALFIDKTEDMENFLPWLAVALRVAMFMIGVVALLVGLLLAGIFDKWIDSDLNEEKGEDRI